MIESCYPRLVIFSFKLLFQHNWDWTIKLCRCKANWIGGSPWGKLGSQQCLIIQFGSHLQSCALEVFYNLFNNKKWFFLQFLSSYQSSPVQFKKPTPSQNNLIKNAKKNFCYWKNSKILQAPSSAHLYMDVQQRHVEGINQAWSVHLTAGNHNSWQINFMNWLTQLLSGYLY